MYAVWLFTLHLTPYHDTCWRRSRKGDVLYESANPSDTFEGCMADTKAHGFDLQRDRFHLVSAIDDVDMVMRTRQRA